MQNTMKETKAVVLGGGGITGIAWEAGLIAGLLSQNVNLAKADMILGTSAGSFVGAALAGGYDMKEYYASQFVQKNTEPNITAGHKIMLLWLRAYLLGGRDMTKMGKYFGEIAMKYSPKVSKEERIAEERTAVVKSRLVVHDWSPNLKITAIDAATGVLNCFDYRSGISLEQAVLASGAVPGVWPYASFLGKDWVDGGMVSSANASLANGYKKIVILAPLPKKYGFAPGVIEDILELRKRSEVFLFTPDEVSRQAIGKNIYDSARTALCARAGFEQGAKATIPVRKIWESGCRL